MLIVVTCQENNIATKLITSPSCPDQVKPPQRQVISNNQICTILRTRHQIKVEIRADLGDCDYVVNSNTALLRIHLIGQCFFFCRLIGQFLVVVYGIF